MLENLTFTNLDSLRFQQTTRLVVGADKKPPILQVATSDDRQSSRACPLSSPTAQALAILSAIVHAIMTTKSTKTRQHTTTNSSSLNFESRNKRRIDSLMKAYVRHLKFSGFFFEDVNVAIEEFETLARSCEVGEEDMLKGIPIMLKGAAFSHYSRKFAKRNLTLSELIDAFLSCYTSEEQRKKTLRRMAVPFSS